MTFESMTSVAVSLPVLGAINWRWDFYPHAQVAVNQEEKKIFLEFLVLL